MKYPSSRKEIIVENLHGKLVEDPYRWLEDIDSEETASWVAGQSEFTKAFLEQLPGREKLQLRLRQLWDFEKYDIPVQKKNRLFYSHNTGLLNQPIYYWQDGLMGEPHELINPNLLSTDGTVALVGFVPSPDGKLFAYGFSVAGSDWMTWKVRDVESGSDLPDLLEWVKFSGASWTSDSRGFFYSRYDAPVTGEQDIKGTNYYQKLFYHRLGDVQSSDQLIYQDEEHKEWGFGGEVSDDGMFLVVTVWQGTHRENGILYSRLDDPDRIIHTLTLDFDANYQFLGNIGDNFYFETDLNAPFGRIISIDLKNPERENWIEIVPQGQDAILFSTWVGKKIYITRLHDVVSQISCYDLKGNLVNVLDLPGQGTIPAFGGPSGEEAKQAFYLFTNFFTPLAVYRYDLETRESFVFRKPNVNFDPDGYTMKQIFYYSKDGTRVPMFICHKRGIVYNGDTPTYLYAYGGFNAPSLPAFSLSALLWMEIGGIYALANIRGGGEYGKAWHEAGIKANKQNVFDDFIAAAEWLIANGYTRTKRLAIGGRSNGGLLIGACLTQRPDLFGATLPIVGVLDMLRFHKFTIGWAWVSDYGSPENHEEFGSLYTYSPYHNIREGQIYPPTLICTGDHDDRVFPAHSFKFAARLQTAQAGNSPILIRIDINAGHGMGKPTAKLIEELADQWAFLAKALDFDISA